MFESFKPNPQLLKQLNFPRLLAYDRTDTIFDLMIFILRYYKEVDYEDYSLSQENLHTLKKQEIKRIWLTLDHLLSEFRNYQNVFKSRNVRKKIKKNITAKALGEIFTYMEKLKKGFLDVRSPSNQNSNSIEKNNSNENDPLNKKNPSLRMSQIEAGEYVARKDFDNLKNEIAQLKTSMKDSKTNLFRETGDRIKKENIPDDYINKSRLNINDSISGEIITIKRKFSEMEVTVDSLKNGIERMKNDSKTKFNQMQETIQTEIESLKLYKDRVNMVNFLG